MKPEGTRRNFVLIAVIGSLLIMVMVIAGTLYATKRTLSATDEAVQAVSSFYLEAMADRRAQTITSLINSNFDEMDKALMFLKDQNIESQEDLREAIGTIKSLLSLQRFAVVDTDNIVYMQYTTYTGRSRYEFLSEETMSDRTISTLSLYGADKQLCLAVPISGLTLMGKKFKACFVQININEIVNLLAFDDKEGRTYYGIYSKYGVNLSDTELGPEISTRNFFDAIKGVVSEEVLKKNMDHFENGQDGNLTISSGGATETLSYVPIPDTGWQMAVLIRESVIQDQIRDISEKNLAISRNLILFTLLSVLFLALALLRQYRKLSREELEAEKETSRNFRNMANTDSMTGVRNKHAYSENETALNQKIQAGEIDKLGVVVCDINGLKHVNDTQGHAAGDKLIKDACSLICENFSHGAVFRIGGDEFVVLLQEKGYSTMQETVDALNRKIEDNIEKNAVVISIGFASLTPEDTQLRDVFERADQMMYKRKKELKEMGANTRNEE